MSVFIAFGAGLLSFFSPCVLPLIPSYLCVIGGSPLSGDENYNPKPIARTVSFILGFGAIFIILSVIFSSTIILVGGLFRYINIISGLIVIVLGLNIIFDFLALLNYEKRFHLKNKPKGVIGAFLAGNAFGAGWTPCVGPVLTGILLLAAKSGSIPLAVLYLIFYTAGLGLPFLLASFFFNAFVKFSAKLRTFIPIIRRISGVLLILIGVLIVKGDYRTLNIMAASWQNKLSSKKPYAESSVLDATPMYNQTENDIEE